LKHQLAGLASFVVVIEFAEIAVPKISKSSILKPGSDPLALVEFTNRTPNFKLAWLSHAAFVNVAFCQLV
jgi:hypothetical protein